MSTLADTVTALRARARLIQQARALAQMNAERAAVCTKDQQALAQFLRENAATLRNLANAAEGATP